MLSLEPERRARGGTDKLVFAETDSVQAIVEAVGFWAQGADGGASAQRDRKGALLSPG